MIRRIAVGVAAMLLAMGSALCVALRAPSWFNLADRVATRADAERLRRHVQELAGALAPRDVQHPEHLEAAADYVEGVLRSTGATVSAQPFVARGLPVRNVIAELGPASAERVVVGAHYDAVGEFGENPGADDNASGTAGLLELARVLARAPLRQRVELVAFTTEEPPFFAAELMGSAVHASSLAADGTKVCAMLCLEMIGRFTDRQDWPSTLLRMLYPTRGDFVAVIGRWPERPLASRVRRPMNGAGANAVSYSGPFVPGMDASDHRSYWARGIADHRHRVPA